MFKYCSAADSETATFGRFYTRKGCQAMSHVRAFPEFFVRSRSLKWKHQPSILHFPPILMKITPPAKVGLCKTSDAAVSCQTLRRLRRAILTSGIVLIHDNDRPHIAVVTQQLLEQFKWEVSDHPAYSPDLATSDFHPFPELKDSQGGQSFQKYEKNQSSVKAHLTSLAVTFFEEEIENLVHPYGKWPNLHRDYVEK
ncbi:hypothetical protein AVEN_272544-1 [Araneus ventricosus]|uniref:Histone-lysine N-methyltransferase SETMAR n=1 Tax=Araneus ventricosus TaxID=182803 RepID=A0A4Y2EBZ9_ARAVE|nr:hypothetical protein AVEN_272544-1 [Araneus ventricosus]